LFLSVVVSASGFAEPVVDPIADVTIPAGKSLIVPITATSTTRQPLTYTVTSSTKGIAVVMHTNNPFWQLSVAQAADASAPGAYQTPYRGGLVTVTNVGTMTFMLFPEYAPHTINVFQGLTTAGFYNSNTIFHRVVSDFVIQGGDPQTNGSGGLVFNYDDEFNPQALFTGNGQLALANSAKNANGSQFFVTVGAQRSLDFSYTLFGQLVRGFDVLTNINYTAVDTNSRPLADEIIQTASYVADTADTVLTLTATNVPGLVGTITVIADDGVGGRTTNAFGATLVLDTNSNNQPFIYPNTVTNLVAPVNTTLTNFVNAVELDGDELYWYPSFVPQADYTNAPTSGYDLFPNVLRTLTYNVTNVDGRLKVYVVPARNYIGPVNLAFDVTYNSQNYDEQVYKFVFGDTPVSGQPNTVTALASVPFNNVLLATFTNGVPGSSSTNFTAFINWGDNSTNSGVVTANAVGKKAVLGSHTYVYPGTYPVYVQIQSAIGASATVLSFVTVTNQAAAATSLLTVHVTGPGTVSPGYSNAPLAVGGSYSISGIPADLSLLASWTDGSGFVLGTGTNLTFTMYPGLSLTANFVLAAQPTLKIVSPSSGHAVTNLYSAPATVSGTAANNATITSVRYQVNSAGWLDASGTTNWTASFTPAYGVTNVIQAYAVNNFGFVSTTSRVSVVYLAGDVLTVSTNGHGKITPVLNGLLLPLGTNYVLTATPVSGSGFVFGGWTGSLSATNAVLKFRMAANMSLTANFVDNTKPILAFANLKAGQSISNAVFTVNGTASDNWQVANVWLKLDGGDWTNAVSANNWTNWSAILNLIEGTNTVWAYSEDSSGNLSVTSRVSFVYVPSDWLRVMTSGRGSVSPNYSNAWLAIGRNLSMTATAGSGYVFSNWTGGVLSSAVLTNNRTLKFVMQSNLVLTANFIPNPFIPAAGTYQGLFYDTNGMEQLSSGYFSGTVNSNGIFTAKLQQGLNSYPLSGQFSLTGAWFTNSIKGASNVSAWLQLDLSGEDVLTGVLSNASWTAELTADRAVYSKANPAPQVGKYTLVMPGNTDAAEEPGGNGFGSVNVDMSGNVTFLGMLGDGTKVTQTTIVSKQGQWPLYLVLYSGKGSMLGWLDCTNEADRDIDGLLSWTKPAGTTTSLYPAGFTNEVEAMGSVYVFTNGLRVLDITNGLLILDNGNLSQALTNGFVLGTNNALSGTNLSHLTITNTTGLFGGTLTNPTTHKAISIGGAVLQKVNAGYGNFLGTNQSGSVKLQKNE
jgi:uncharacterized repeat protein (TIGR02543 family)